MQLMGIEIPSGYGGAGGSFMASILMVEELAKVDGSLSVMCDIQNTLINTLMMQLGTEPLKQRYLPRLATDTVCLFSHYYYFWAMMIKSKTCFFFLFFFI